MADNSEQPSQKAIASQFPNPPPFWRAFTADNVARMHELRASRAEQDNGQDQGGTGFATQLPVRLPDVPADLLNLQPPAEPPAGTWKVLGGAYSLDDRLPSLEETSIRRLAPSYNEERDGKHLDRAFELKRMAKSLLLNFLELVGIMGIAPEDAAPKVDDLRTILMNFHHVLNEYRPHQARESAIALMQSHLDRTRAETAAIRAQVDKAKRVLEGLGSLKIPSDRDGVKTADGAALVNKTEQKHREREAEVWAAADALLA